MSEIKGSYEKKQKFEVPPAGVDWLWWHPDEPANRQYDGSFARYFCYNCDIRWDASYTLAVQPRCWCCGRFIKKNKPWSYS